jgi:hypothetical protein
MPPPPNQPERAVPAEDTATQPNNDRDRDDKTTIATLQATRTTMRKSRKTNKGNHSVAKEKDVNIGSRR